MKPILCLVVLLCSIQSDAPTFYVERVEVLSEYDATYIHWLGNKIVPPDRLVGERDIQCLVSEVTASGVFRDVKTRLHPGDSNSKRLLVSVSSPKQIESFVISEIKLDAPLQADEKSFQQALDKRGVKLGLPFLRLNYRELYEKILDALHEVHPDRSLKDAREDPWITIRPANPGQLKLTVSPTYSGCNTSVK